MCTAFFHIFLLSSPNTAQAGQIGFVILFIQVRKLRLKFFPLVLFLPYQVLLLSHSPPKPLLPPQWRLGCMVTGACILHYSGIQSLHFLAPFYLGWDWPLEAKLLVSPSNVLFLSPSAAEIVYRLGLSWVLVPDLRSGLFICSSGKAFRVRGLSWTWWWCQYFLVLNHLLIWAAHQSIGILGSVWGSAHKEAAHSPSTGHMRVGLIS